MKILTCGCFDLFHASHERYLRTIKERYPEAYLVVGLADDLSVRRLKGEGRPREGVATRQRHLEQCEFVDEVVPFEVFLGDFVLDYADGHAVLLRTLKPDLVVSGSGSPNWRVEPFLGNIPHEIIDVGDAETRVTTTKIVDSEIKEVIVMNLQERGDRRKQMLEELEKQGWLEEEIRFWHPRPLSLCRDATGYPQTFNVCMDGVTRGFDYFAGIFDWIDLETGKIWETRVSLADQALSQLSIFQHIAEQDRMCLVLHDDIVPPYGRAELNAVVAELHGLPEPFTMFSLFQVMPRESNAVFQVMLDVEEPLPSEEIDGIGGEFKVFRGFSGLGLDKVNVVSPEGAGRLVQMPGLEVPSKKGGRYLLLFGTGMSMEHMLVRYPSHVGIEGFYALQVEENHFQSVENPGSIFRMENYDEVVPLIPVEKTSNVPEAVLRCLRYKAGV